MHLEYFSPTVFVYISTGSALYIKNYKFHFVNRGFKTKKQSKKLEKKISQHH